LRDRLGKTNAPVWIEWCACPGFVFWLCLLQADLQRTLIDQDEYNRLFTIVEPKMKMLKEEADRLRGK